MPSLAAGPKRWYRRMGTCRDPQAGSNPNGEKINTRIAKRIVTGVFIMSANGKIFSSIVVEIGSTGRRGVIDMPSFFVSSP
jgi:hypothetical protein